MDSINLSKMDYAECARYLGYKGNIPDESILFIMKECEEQLINSAVPRFLYKCFPIEEMEDGIVVNNTELVLTGESIKKHLNGCNKIALIAATLSLEVDKLIKLYSIKDMAKTVVLDAMAAVAIEQLCDKVELLIKENENENVLTSRFGVGYGDLPIELEKDILKILNTEKEIGLYSSDSYTLTPKKSVVCIVGFGGAERHSKSCDNCNMYNKCKYSKRGESCGI